MYRLTTPEGECLALNSYGVECVCTPDENCDEGCLNQRIARLAQYEDTGLTPEQVTELKERREEKEQADNWISCKESKNIGEYISKQKVLDYLNGYLHSLGEGGADTLLFDRGQRRALINSIQDILAVKAADVQPVKHGKWEKTHISLVKYIPEDEKEEGHSFYMAELKCSCCERYNVVTFALTLNKPDFCQLCGARMDGDVE